MVYCRVFLMNGCAIAEFRCIVVIFTWNVSKLYQGNIRKKKKKKKEKKSKKESQPEQMRKRAIERGKIRKK